jgi:hypothetical protein
MSMLNPPEREKYLPGGKILELGKKLYDFGSKVVKPLNEGQKKTKDATQAQAVYKKGQAKAVLGTVGVGTLIYSNISEDDLPDIMKKAEAANVPVKVIDERINPEDYPVYKKNTDSAKAFRQAQRDAKKAGADFFKFEGRDYNTREKKAGGSLIGDQREIDANDDGDITGEDFEILRDRKAEGSLMMPEEGMPVDTYPNIPPEEMAEVEASQLPDDEMEDNYIKFMMDESLNDEEQDYLAEALQKDPMLSDIMDKVITTASEFSGAGEVDGPGTGVSDSIPARLSDGEFVFTKKATDQMGADNLQRMMDDAERAFDGGYQMKAMGGMMDEEEDPEVPGMSKTKEEIEKLMMGANRMPSLQ